MSIKKLKYNDTVLKIPVVNIASTKQLKGKITIVGQDKAMDALQLGISSAIPHYNIFVSGIPGTGRKTSVRYLLGKIKIRKKPDDKCYVYNFSDPDSPILLRFKAGKGKLFKKTFEGLVSALITSIPNVIQGDPFREMQEQILEKYRKKEDKMMEEFEKKALSRGFAVSSVQVGPYKKPILKPILKGKPVDFATLSHLVAEGKLKEKEYKNAEETYRELSYQLEDLLKKTNEFNKKAVEEVENALRNIIKPIIEIKLEPLKKNYKDKKTQKFLNDFINEFMEDLREIIAGKTIQFPEKYRVNLLIDNTNVKSPPIVFENSPTFQKLFGTIEVRAEQNGVFKTDFTMIKGGSLLKADGGFLILNAYDVLIEPNVWQKLKRTLRNGDLEIQTPETLGVFGISALKPEPIKVDVKVIMIGEPYLYELLYNEDREFGKLFKVRADFDYEIPLNEDAVRHYAFVLKKISEDEKLLPVDKSGIYKTVEVGARKAGRRDKITSEFNFIADILREANFWALSKKKRYISDKDIEKAVEHRYLRSNLIEEKILGMIRRGDIYVDVTGEKVGQINGLEIYSIGGLEFGKPVKLTASISIGEKGIINIEREVKLSGPIHSKGVLIIAGFLRDRFAKDKPLSLHASITFEQSYSGIDGDSASSTELYSILSAISGIPIRQNIAVTGSVNQKGYIQPIGGVNEKIEGFFDTCKILGFTGDQGVMIPSQNAKDLVLKNKVLDAIKKEQFHLYTVDTIEEGIEVLTGKPYEEIYSIVNEKLSEFAKLYKSFYR